MRTALFPMLRTAVVALLLPSCVLAAVPRCEVASGQWRTPVVELYTSEGCSSCPPADKWLASLKGQPVVAQAFHVTYWDYIGWKDRFANPAFSQRQRDLARDHGVTTIYTPQVVRNAQDWPDWHGGASLWQPLAPAQAHIALKSGAAADSFEAEVVPANPAQDWSAYWTVTEDGHSSRVRAGENAGEYLQHDFVVRQYREAGSFRGTQSLHFDAPAADAGHARHINLVVSARQGGAPLQAVSLQCP